MVSLNGGLAGEPALCFPGDERHSHPRPQELDHPRGRSPRGEARPGRRRGRPRPLEADPRPRLPARQGAARRPRGGSRSRRRPRRGRRSPRPVGLSRRAHRAGDPAAHERRGRDRPGRGGQAAHLQGDRPGPARGRARRLPELQLQARDRDHRRGQGRQGHRGAARLRTRRSPRSRIAARRTATTRSSSTRAPATARRSRAARPSGCR